jgi:hypothetical protein
LENEEMHKDLQTSIGQSGMAVLILAEVFRELQNLRTVRIDVTTLHTHADEPEQDVIGIRCGRKPTYKGESLEPKLWGGKDRCSNQVYALAMLALEKASAHEKVELHLEFRHSVSDDHVISSFFDLETSLWRDHLSEHVRRVHVYYSDNDDWFRRLLSSTNGLSTSICLAVIVSRGCRTSLEGRFICLGCDIWT